MADKPVDSKKDVGVVEGVGEFLHSAAYNFAQTPIDGITQAAGKLSNNAHWKAPQLISAPENHDMWTGAGNIVGSLGQFIVASKVMRKGLSTSGIVASGAPLSLWETAASGAAVDLLHPIDPKVNGNLSTGGFLLEKGRSAGVAFGTFAVMGGINEHFANTGVLGRAGRRTLAESVSVNTISGLGGGLANAQLDAWSHGKLVADASEYISKGGEYAAFGAMFGVAEAGLYKANYSLRPAKGTESGISRAPTTEEFVTKRYDGAQPLQSEILSWLADTNPNLRPPNYAQWRAETSQARSVSAVRELDLMDWRPEQRPQVINELRRLAGTHMAKDANIDAFITRINGIDEVRAYQQNAWTPERTEALSRWSNASERLRNLVESDTTLWERRWKDILTDEKLHAQRPDVKQLADAIINGEKNYHAIAESERTASGVQDGLHNELNRISRAIGLPRLNRGFEVEINDAGGGYYNNWMNIGDRRVVSSPGSLSEATIHEMRHHEQGRNLSKEIVGPIEYSGQPPALSQHRAEVEMRFLQREGGTFDFLKRLGDPESITHRVLWGPSPREVRSFAEYVHRGEANPARWDEAGIKENVRQFLDKHVLDMVQEARRRHFEYVGSRVEIPAWSVGFLSRVRAQALGLRDVHAPELPSTINAKDLLKTD